MEALIDGDILGFRCAASAEEEPEEVALLRLDRLVQEVLYVTSSDSYKIFLTGSDNFRKEIYPEYKANRKDKEPPKHLQACREYLVKQWNAKITDGCEADDMLGVEQTDNTVIVSIDKDLLQIEGKHYNFVKQEWYDVSEMGGIRHFYEQLLKGDRTDNVPGIAGIGEKKAQRLLEGCNTEEEMYEVCREQYQDDDLMMVYGKCLWIWRYEGDIWRGLTGKKRSEQETEPMSDSTIPTEAGINQYMEPIIQEQNGFLADGNSLEATEQMTSLAH